MTVMPWWLGLRLVWDATFPDTFAMSYRAQATNTTGCVTVHVEKMNCGKYFHLVPKYLFQPMVIESSGAGPSSLGFFFFFLELQVVV